MLSSMIDIDRRKQRSNLLKPERFRRFWSLDLDLSNRSSAFNRSAFGVSSVDLVVPRSMAV